MSDAVERFLEVARGLGLELQAVRYPQGTRTAADAAAAIGCQVGQIVKSLVFMTERGPVLALTSGAARVDLEKLAQSAGADEARRATPEEARAATGFAVGGTPPFGHPVAVRAFLDEDLLAYQQVWAAAGTPNSVFAITPQDLVRVAGAEVAAFAET
jgi:prolyl-tRNA editing enzyme YbaK/EbsC (Cys-tRNA(Pro) deacylase)